jgi:PKD repeat protein
VVKHEGNWYGFIVSRQNNKLFRLDFGESLDNAPLITDLTNIDGLLNSPQTVKVINDKNLWYVFVQNMTENELIRYEFGSDLTGAPIKSDIILNTTGAVNNGFDINFDGLNWVAAIGKGTRVILLNFRGLLSNNISSEHIIQTNAIPGANNIADLNLIKVNGIWYGFIVSYSSRTLHKLEFGNTLFAIPASSLLSNAIFNPDAPYGVEVHLDGNQLVGHVVTLSGNLYRFIFDDLTEEPSFSQLGKLGALANTVKIAMAKVASQWFAFSVNYVSNQFYKIKFPNNCDANMQTSAEFNPVDIFYSEPGQKTIELSAKFTSGCSEQLARTITVKNQTAPTTSFATENACIDNENVFNASSADDATITSWSWDFGDGTAPTSGQNVSHQFLGTGNYEVKLSVEAANGCSNTAGKTISIYNAPVSDFTYTSGITCSNSPLSFSNSTVFSGPDSVLSYSWNMDGEAILDTKNPAYTFASGGDKTITLSAAIPGCTNTQSQIVSITPGPLTSFSFAGSCAYDNYQFINATTGENITGYYWNFGDGYTSSVASPSHNFASAGNYVVSLTASNASGCNTAMQQVVAVHYIPQLNFTNDLACSENPVTFYDQSSVANANITEQYWTLSNNLISYKSEGFGPTPSFRLGEAGEYTMTLIGISNYGCTDTLMRHGVNVKQSPVADFTYENNCYGDTNILSQAVDLPEGVNLLTVDWLIDGLLFSGNELQYKFPRTGSQEVEMFVRADNLCTGSVSKTVDIIALPAIDMQLSSHCEDQPVLVSALTNPGSDPVRSYSWSIDGNPVSSQQYFSYTFKNPADYAISLLVTTASNCDNALEEVFTINPSPVSEFEVFPSIGASPLVVQFTDKSKGATSVLYDFSTFNDDKNSSFNPVYTYTTLGKDMPIQIATNAFGCTDTSFVQIEVVIPVYDLAIIGAGAQEVSGKLKLFVELRNKGTIIVNNPQIRIDIDERISLNQQLDGRLMPGDIQKFEIDFEVFMKNESLNYICFSTENILGNYVDSNPYNNVQCLSIENSFTVMDPFPNPSRTFVELPIILPSPGKCDIRMVSQGGDLIFAREFKNLPSGLNVIKVDLSTYSQGMYLFNISYGENETTKKVVIR